MPSSNTPFPPEFASENLELVRPGRTVTRLAKEFRVSDQTVATERARPISTAREGVEVVGCGPVDRRAWFERSAGS